MIPAIPPEDYSGSIAEWIIALNECGYDGDNYTNIKIPEDIYDEILDWCEH